MQALEECASLHVLSKIMFIFKDVFSKLLVITTVHSYIYAGTLNSLETNSDVKEDLNKIHQLKTNLQIGRLDQTILRKSPTQQCYDEQIRSVFIGFCF